VEEVKAEDKMNTLKNYLKRYYENQKEMPKFNSITKKIGVTRYELTRMLRILEHDGFLVRNYNQYALPSSNGQKKKITMKSIIEHKNDFIIIVLRVLMIIIGIGAIILSTYYTSIWLFSFLPSNLAILLSFIMVSFSVAAFEVIIFLRKNRQWILIAVFSVIWLIVTCFSMMSTIAGQYNARIIDEKEDITEKSEEIHSNSILESYIEEEEEIETYLLQKKDRVAYLVDFITSFNLELLKEKNSKRIYDESVKELHRIENEIRLLRNDLEDKKERRRVYLNEQKEEGIVVVAEEEKEKRNISFYKWIGAVFAVDVMYIEFWLSVFPAVFIDIIAPLAVAVGMFLKRKEGKKSE